MLRAWPVSLIVFWIGCTSSPVPSGFLDHESEPSVLFRCEQGRIAAYISLEAQEQVKGDSLPEDAVAVQLDSSPSCEVD